MKKFLSVIIVTVITTVFLCTNVCSASNNTASAKSIRLKPVNDVKYVSIDIKALHMEETKKTREAELKSAQRKRQNISKQKSYESDYLKFWYDEIV